MAFLSTLSIRLLLLFFIGSALSQSTKVVDDSGATFTGVTTSDGKSCCSVKAKQYIDKGKKNNVQYCAVLFEDAACHSCKKLTSGWDEGIQQGKRTFPKFDLSGNSRFREDSESVIVAPGCIFVGYDESEPETDESKRAQERRTIASAIGRSDWVYKEFTDLKDDIERVECYCGADAANKLAREIKRFTSAKCEGNKLNYAASGIGGALVGAAASAAASQIVG